MERSCGRCKGWSCDNFLFPDKRILWYLRLETGLVAPFSVSFYVIWFHDGRHRTMNLRRVWCQNYCTNLISWIYPTILLVYGGKRRILFPFYLTYRFFISWIWDYFIPFRSESVIFCIFLALFILRLYLSFFSVKWLCKRAYFDMKKSLLSRDSTTVR